MRPRIVQRKREISEEIALELFNPTVQKRVISRSGRYYFLATRIRLCATLYYYLIAR